MHINRKQWYKDQWDKEIFKEGRKAWHNCKTLKANPYSIETNPIDHAVWILGWSYAATEENPDNPYWRTYK